MTRTSNFFVQGLAQQFEIIKGQALEFRKGFQIAFGFGGKRGKDVATAGIATTSVRTDSSFHQGKILVSHVIKNIIHGAGIGFFAVLFGLHAGHVGGLFFSCQ